MAAHVLIVPGLNGSGPDHWQTRWEEERVDCSRVEQANWDDPDPLSWIARIDAAVSAVSGPVVIAAHSLGCLAVGAWATLSTRARDSRIGALLVAPCDPAQEGACEGIRRFGLIARGRLPFPSILIASSNDPYISFGRGSRFASEWGSELIDAGEAGHINAQSQLGSWHWGQHLLDRMKTRLTREDLAVLHDERAGRLTAA
jgi:predicted alpha/beta hydrolase family esterase